MSPKQEILTITELCMEITDLTPERAVHCCSSGSATVSVTVFNASNDIDWQKNLYEWERDECYLAQLRFLRHTLEEMHKEALAMSKEEAA